MNKHDLRIIFNAHVSLVALETYDEPRALELLESLFRCENLMGWRWTVTDGLSRLGFGLELVVNEKRDKPEDILQYIKQCKEPSAFVLCDFHPYLDDPKIIRHLKDIVLSGKKNKHKIVLLSHEISLPKELNRYAATTSLSMPDENEILAIIREEARTWAQKNKKDRIKTDNVTLKKLVKNLTGLTHIDVRRLAHGAIADDGAITDSDLPEVSKAKFRLMDMDGVLHYEYSTAHLRDVGGLNKLKSWLDARRARMLDKDSTTDSPKGVLLFGVQGGGKSLAAKAIAGMWGLPLLRLDMPSLLNKFIGESEKNLREALKLADLMSPCVLWIDELEKGLANDASDDAIGKRLLGILLTWMSERKSRVFLVATSNDISQLPPELMRKGRFDEIFFVDLPDHNTRSLIFNIHLEKRDIPLSGLDLTELANLSEGFTGAEIEQVVVSAVYASSARKLPLLQNDLVISIQSTQPLSVVMAEKMANLRAWAEGRAVPAN